MGVAERDAARLLKEHDIDAPPVDVLGLARELGVTIEMSPAERGVSGMLFRDRDRAVIGVNSTDVPRRRRFTVAHEIGHLRLHPGRPIILDHYVRAPEVRVNLRDRISSEATDTEEIQANAFAAALLMPENLVLEEVAKRIEDGAKFEQLLRDLADTFEVSRDAMSYRLVNLGVITA